MPVFHLLPREDGLRHPAWSMSWHSNPCAIVADTPQQARQFANGAFIIPIRSETGPVQDLPLPWSSAELVEARRAPGMTEFGQNGALRVDNSMQPMLA